MRLKGPRVKSAILERLEETKRYGLVSDYAVTWRGHQGHHQPRITVWGRDGTPEDVVQDYIARLLKGLVLGQEIEVAR